MSEQFFISYRSENEQIANQVYTFLESQGLNPWIASKDIKPSDNWDKKVPQAIKRSEYLLVLITRDIGESEHVRKEARTAIDNDVNIIPLFVEGADFSDELGYLIGEKQGVNVSKPPQKEEIDSLVDSLDLGDDYSGTNVIATTDSDSKQREQTASTIDRIPNEEGVERSILEWLDNLGWEAHGKDGAAGAETLDDVYERDSQEVVYWELLSEQIVELNESMSEDDVERFIDSLRRDLDAENLIDGNRDFYELLIKGKSYSSQNESDGNETDYVDLIDLDPDTMLENNRFHAVSQFSVSRETTIRPDVSLFVNGIPLVTMELKSLAQDNDWHDAVSDLQSYEEDVPRLFLPGLFNIAADTMELRYGAVGASREFYEPWNDAPEQYEDDNELKQAVSALCNPETILDVLNNFVFFEQRAGGDAKIIPRFMQYYAVNSILERVQEETHDRGLIWHTQGSGKSFTMLYAVKNLLFRSNIANNPQVFIIVDTDKLNSQMRDQLANISLERWVEAQSIDHLEQLIEEGNSQLVLTTIHKFESVDPEVQGNDEVIVMSDEAHRFMEADLGSRLAAALPNCYHFGFTGTPVQEGEKQEDRNTFREFSPEDEDYLHRYSIKQGIDDGLILPVYFTLRHQMEWDIDEDAMDEEFEKKFQELPTSEKGELIREDVTSTMLAEIEPRVNRVVEEIEEHFNEQVAPNDWKGMVVTPSRRSAAMYGERWVNKIGEDAVEVMYTATNDDSDLIQQFHTDSAERDSIVNSFKKDDDPRLLVVHNMLLTGFDAPVLKTMYLDRNIKNHTLLQAIARTNRPAKGKENGEIVDFQGVFDQIDEALDYEVETKAYAARDKDNLYSDLTDQIKTVMSIFDGIPKTDTQEATAEAIERVSTHPERREFKKQFRELQNLYEAVAPDERLINHGIEDDYKWLNRIHVAFKRTTSGEEEPEEDVQEKTREIINEYVDIPSVKDNFPTYKLGEDVLEGTQSSNNPAVKASQVAHATQEHLHAKENQNPLYRRLSERVNDIVEGWQGGEIDDPEAVDALKAIENETVEVKTEAEKMGMNEAEYAIYVHLTEEISDAVESESQAKEIAEAIVSRFEAEIDRSYAGWKSNDDVLTEIYNIIFEILIKEFDLGSLIKDDDNNFTNAAQEYLVRNYA